MWLSLVERLNGVQEAASSILVTPTDDKKPNSKGFGFFCALILRKCEKKPKKHKPQTFFKKSLTSKNYCATMIGALFCESGFIATQNKRRKHMQNIVFTALKQEWSVKMEKNRIHQIKSGKNTRMSFAGQKTDVLEMPNLIDIQKASYDWFLEYGLKEVFRDVSPIDEGYSKVSLEFGEYTI